MDVNSFVIGYTKGKQSASGGGEGGIAGFHKVQFFNDDRTTLLYTVFVPTGASAIYAGDTPVSAGGGTFVGFEPSPTNVTADLDCYAVYELISTLNKTSWRMISKTSADGTAQNYFAVGDTKMIHIQGTVGTLEVNGDYGVYIIGFDHNSEIEGNGIHFGTFKSAASNGKDLCLISSEYNSVWEDGKKCFNMNHWGNYNYGGWSACDLRYDILGSTDKKPLGYGSAKTASSVGYDASETCATNPVPNTLMAALPADLRAVMKPMTKYTNNKGSSDDTAEKVTVTVDYLPLLAEFEIFGARFSANSYEKNKQKQYDYFVAGKSKKKYCHSSTDSAARWWERSACYTGDNLFCNVSTNSTAESSQAMRAFGVAPAFKV